MTQGADGPDADALAYVCDQWSDLRAVLRAHRGTPAADQTLVSLAQAVLDGSDTTEILRDLHAALRAAGDPLGVFGHARSAQVVGVDGPYEIVYLCPVNHCSGRSWAAAAAGEPTCAVAGRTLRRERLV